MPNLKIDYDPVGRLALLSTDEPHISWSQVRRVCDEHTDETEIISETSLTLPWWAFLSCRDELSYFVDRYDVDVEAGEAAWQLLEEALDRTDAFRASSEASPLTKKKMAEELRKAGLTRRLTRHQSRNVSKLAALQSGATFSVPGAGKTTEALAVYFLKREKEIKAASHCSEERVLSMGERATKVCPRV